MADPYSPYEHLDKPLMLGAMPPPRNDAEAVDLVKRSKAALDHQTTLHARAHPAVKQAFAKQRQQHIDNVAGAIHRLHGTNPSPVTQQIIDAMHGDPGIKISHPKPQPIKKP